MNLQESIRKILREETEYVKDVRVKISDILKTNRDGQSLDDAIVNVQDGLKSYSEGPPFLLKIGDKYEVLDGFHRIAKKILDGKKYIISDVMIKESNMNLQESIRRILREDISNRGKEKLIEMIKTLGVVSTSKVVNGVDNLVKKLGLDMDDLKTQEMLVKSFIYHADIEDVDILHLEINRDRQDKVRIKIHFNTNHPARNIESWLVGTLVYEMNKFFPFKTAASWEPAFAGRGVTVILDSEQIVNDDEEEID